MSELKSRGNMRRFFQSRSTHRRRQADGLQAAGLDARVLSELVETAAEAILITGPSGEVCYANSAYFEIFELPEDAIPVPGPTAVLGGNDAQADRFYRLQNAAARGSRAEEMLSTERDGAVHILQVSVAPIPSRVGFCVWKINIAPAREVARSAQEGIREETFRAVDEAPLGFVMVNGDGVISFANTMFARWTGRTSAEITRAGLRTADVFENDAPLWSRAQHADQPEWTGIEGLRVIGAAGGAVPVSGLSRTCAAAGGLSPELQIFLHDARAPSGLEPTQLQRTEPRFSRLFDVAPVGIAIVQPDAVVLATNAAFAQDFELPLQPGDDFLAIVGADYRADVALEIADAVRAEQRDGYTEIEIGEGEAAHSVQLYASPLPGAQGPSVVLYLIDTTEQKRLELQFAQSQKMQAVGQLAGGIAHDFNNLLTAIIGYSDLLLGRHSAGDPSFTDIHQVKQNANRAANLVRQLLAFSRQQTLSPRVISVTDMLAELNNLLRRLLGQNIELTMTHGRNLGAVKADQGQLENVIINLAVNARDAMADDGGVLSIRTANISAADARALDHAWMPPGECVLIEVSDNGEGIPKEIVGKIFEPFFSTKEVGKGTGLGLSTAYGIIKQQGGNIYVDSESGDGAVFRIYLPRYDDDEGVEPDPAIGELLPADLTGKGVILLVEDEDPVRAFASRALSGKGYTVLEASDGERALEIVAERSAEIDLVISDVVMPNMDGATLVKRIQESNPDIRAIFISGYAESAFRDGDQPPGEHVFLPKPFTLKQLASRVKEVLGGG